MSSYKSDPQLIACDIATVSSKLSDPSSFKKTIDANVDSLADDARENLKKVTFDADAITIESPMGPVKLVVAQKVEPTMITYAAAQAPVNFSLVINLEPVDDNTTRSQAELQLDVPVFIKAMVGPQLERGAKQFGEMLSKLPYKNM